MNDDQVDLILRDLVKTRESFDAARDVFDQAVSQIRWNRINTRIMYGLIATVFVLGAALLSFYFQERRESCQEHNQIRTSVDASLDATALAIGTALEGATNAPHEAFEEYVRIYLEQAPPAALRLEDCG